MQVAFFEVDPQAETQLRSLLATLNGVEATFYPEPLDQDTARLAQGAGAISVFVHSSVTREVLSRLPDLKLVLTRSTGYDHVDLKTCAERGITACNVPSYGSRTVAEFAFALILGLSRRAFDAYRRVKDSNDFDANHFEGFDLYGKTLGVVGTGRIGQHVIEIGRGFGMTVLGFDAYPNQTLASRLGFSYVPFEELLGKSDVVTLHVPYNDQTHHLINRSNISSFKRGSLLINTARGEVVETEAILGGIRDGTLRGAGLDVLEAEKQIGKESDLLAKEEEPTHVIKTLLEDRVLIDLPQVAVTPHIAFNTTEARAEINRVTVENLAAFVSGKPQNTVGR